jgi:hypothetical protein
MSSYTRFRCRRTQGKPRGRLVVAGCAHARGRCVSRRGDDPLELERWFCWVTGGSMVDSPPQFLENTE